MSAIVGHTNTTPSFVTPIPLTRHGARIDALYPTIYGTYTLSIANDMFGEPPCPTVYIEFYPVMPEGPASKSRQVGAVPWSPEFIEEAQKLIKIDLVSLEVFHRKMARTIEG